jgi:hypothetical protein
MDRRITFPVFGKAPQEYDARYVDALVASLASLMNVLRSPGEGRQTTMTLTDLPTNDYGLEEGALFQVNGAVRTSLLDSPYVEGFGTTCSVGTVAVTIS